MAALPKTTAGANSQAFAVNTSTFALGMTSIAPHPVTVVIDVSASWAQVAYDVYVPEYIAGHTEDVCAALELSSIFCQ